VASWSAASLYFNHARYDELGRLKTAGAVSYTYDGFGNRLTQTAPSMNLAYNASNNRITSAGYTYDANGNLTATPELTLAYDVENRLVEAVHATNGTERYAYAPNGQRVWKSGWQGGIYFYGVDGKVLGLYRLTEVYYGEPGTEPVWYDVMQEQWTNVYLGGRMVRGRNYSVVEDRLGTVNGPATNPYGDGQTYEGYGFTGYYHDGITGFDYAQQRYYAPALGRFTTPDPSNASSPSDPGIWNKYAYVAGDPINFNDPSGLSRAELVNDGLFCPSIVTLNGYDIEGAPTTTWLFGAQVLCGTQPGLGRRPRLTLTEQIELDLNVSETCAKGLVASGKRGGALERARAFEKTLRTAADANGIDWTLLAAIGMMETGFQNNWQKDSQGRDMIGHGAGVFQVDLSKNPQVSETDAFNIAWAADWAAKVLSSNYAYLKAEFPNFDAVHLLQATAASWNLGAYKFSGNPDTIDVGSRPRDNYGSTVMKLMDCFR